MSKKQLERRLFLLFLDTLVVVLDFLTLQDKHNIRTLSDNIKFICNRGEPGERNAGQRLAFLSVSKAYANKLYIFQQATYIVYNVQAVIYVE